MSGRVTARASRRAIVTVDEGILPFREDPVRRVLADVARYGEWWPGGLRFAAQPKASPDAGARVRISGGPLQSWVATITEVETQRIAASLSDGVWEGEARWTLRPVTEGTAAVLRLEVDPVPWWLRLAVRTMDLPRRHSRRMKTVFEALRRRLAALGEERVPEPTAPPPGSPALPATQPH